VGRIGKRERDRRKRHHRPTMITWLPTGNVAGDGKLRTHAGKKKWSKALTALFRLERSSGDSKTLKLSGSIKRPVYTIEPRPH
jgi:hypothetical protein